MKSALYRFVRLACCVRQARSRNASLFKLKQPRISLITLILLLRFIRKSLKNSCFISFSFLIRVIRAVPRFRLKRITG